MADEQGLFSDSESPMQVWGPRVAGALAGAALVYYGRKPDTGLLGRVATTAGYSLLMKFLVQPALTELIGRAPAIGKVFSGGNAAPSSAA
jgi:hypothetical protein